MRYVVAKVECSSQHFRSVDNGADSRKFSTFTEILLEMGYIASVDQVKADVPEANREHLSKDTMDKVRSWVRQPPTLTQLVRNSLVRKPLVRSHVIQTLEEWKAPKHIIWMVSFGDLRAKVHKASKP